MTALLAALLNLLHIDRLRQEDGLEAVEYALIAALIAVAIAGIVTTLGTTIQATFQSIVDSLNAALVN